MASPEAAKCKEAMKREIQSMYVNQVWNLLTLHPGLKTVGCKWIFKKKTDMDGKVHTYKARLVAKGYTQTYRIDYEETFSLMDVKTTFLNGKLIKDVFMAQLEGFENSKYPKRVCKLQKAIYGLKQASRSCILCFDEKVTQFGFLEAKMSLVYMSKSVGVLKSSCKDLCPKTDEELDQMSRVPYASVIGSIMYAMMCTRPDVSFALSMVNRHQHNPGEGHWTAVKNILKYLRDTKDSKVEEGHVIVKHIRSEDNPADPFTKALAKSRHNEHARSIGLKDNINEQVGLAGTAFIFPPYQFYYPERKLTMEELLNKFIKQGKREQEEMEIFINEFRTTNELLLKEQNNFLCELEIGVYELGRVMCNILVPRHKIKGVTTRGREMTSEPTYNNEVNIDYNQPPGSKPNEPNKPNC
ncbi:retrotransposon protein, putative, ty1-copia subclass [Tanacetum coccineum]